MEPSDKTALAGMFIGFSSSAVFWSFPYLMPTDLQKVVFWVAVFIFLGSALWLLDTHMLGGRNATVRFGLPSLVFVVFCLVLGVASFHRSMGHDPAIEAAQQPALPQHVARMTNMPALSRASVVPISIPPPPIAPWSPALGARQRPNYTRRSVTYFLDILHRFNASQATELLAPEVGKRLIVSGPISTTSAISNVILVGLGLPPNMVTCEFDVSDASALAEYEVGDTITVDGVISRGTGDAGSMFLTLCKLSETAR